MIAYFDLPSGLSGDMTLGCLLDAGWPLEELRAALARLSLPTEEYSIDVRTVQRGAFRATLADVKAISSLQTRYLADIRRILDRADLPPSVKDGAWGVFSRLAEAEAKVHGMTVSDVHFHEVGAVDAIVDIVGAAAGIAALGIDRLYASALPLGPGWTTGCHGQLPLPGPAVLELLAARAAPTRPAPGPGELLTPTGAAILAHYATFEQPPMTLAHVGVGAGQKDFPWPNIARLWLGQPLSPERQPGPNPQPEAAPAASRVGVPAHRPTSRTPEENPEKDRRVSVPAHHPPSPIPSVQPLAPDPESSQLPPTESSSPETTRDNSRVGVLAHRSASLSPIETPAVSATVDGENATPSPLNSGNLVELQTNIDDMNPQLYAPVMDALFAAGARDVWITPIQMKKNRPGVLLSALADAHLESALAHILLRHTTTLGVRVHPVRRHEAQREFAAVPTPWGQIPVKLKRLGPALIAAMPEYDACAQAAAQNNVPVKDIYETALAAGRELLR